MMGTDTSCSRHIRNSLLLVQHDGWSTRGRLSHGCSRTWAKNPRNMGTVRTVPAHVWEAFRCGKSRPERYLHLADAGIVEDAHSC